MNEYDLIIIGGGAGAFAAAIKANELGAKTLMVNKGLPLGGTCVNVGCVPSKTLLWAAEVMHLAKNHKIPGLEIEIKNFDFAAVMRHELDLVTRLRAEKYEKVLSELENVTHLEGKAVFLSPNAIEVDRQQYQAKKFIIASGSTAAIPAIVGLKESGYITHVEALKLAKQPRELIVLGAGAAGLELAQMYARFGTKVTIIHKSASIFRGEKELTAKLAEIFATEGIIIKTNVQLQAVKKNVDKKVVIYIIDGEVKEVSGDEILVSVGKTANTKDLELDKAGVEVDEKQAIKVDLEFKTSNPHIYAVGDVTNAPLRLEPTAGREGTLAVENALNNKQNRIDYASVPWTIFTDPQLAGVGLTEEEQLKQFGACQCKTISFKDVPKALIINRTEGLIKMVVHPKTGQITGVHILSPNAGDLIAQATLLVKNKNTIDDAANSLPMFPTLSEAIKLVALSFSKDISKLSCCV
jgi:mercuric reductase